jgi:hypothetical protein
MVICDLLLAPRRSEHVHCSGGRDVLAAGGITFGRDGQAWLPSAATEPVSIATATWSREPAPAASSSLQDKHGKYVVKSRSARSATQCPRS